MASLPDVSRLAPGHKAAASDRILLLDVLRLLAIVEIIGFHWLRTCQQNGVFGLVWKQGYEDVGIGFRQLGYLLTDQSGFSAGAVLNNAIGLLFGFGWEAVDVFVLLSGLTLALNYRPDRPGFTETGWRLRRLGRILLPYYCIAAVLIGTAEIFRRVAGSEGGALGQMVAKLAGKNLLDPFPIVVLKHLFLLDPRQDFWIAEPFSPAWWFIPPLLVAYMLFPILFRGIGRLGAATALVLALAVSVMAYILTDSGLLPERGWYYIILHECFDFTLGIVVGRALADPAARSRLLRFAGGRAGLATGILLFVAGNLANWSRLTYPLASALFTPGLTLVLASLAAALSRFGSVNAAAQRTDGYHIYLLHQFPAFPLSVLAAALGGYWAREAGFGLGFAVYLAVIAAVVLVFDTLVRRFRSWRHARRDAPPGILRRRGAANGGL